MAEFASDTFTEGSDTALSSHTPDVGGSWVHNTSSLTVIAATDHVTGDSAAATATAYIDSAPGDNDLDISCDIDTNSQAQKRGGVVAYAAVGASTWDGYVGFNVNGTRRLDEVLNNAFSTLASESQANENATFLLQTRPAHGSVKQELFVAGVSELQADDATYATFARAGIICRSGEILDNFSASDGTAVGGATVPLFRNASLSGLGSGGPLFHNPLAA